MYRIWEFSYFPIIGIGIGPKDLIRRALTIIQNNILMIQTIFTLQCNFLVFVLPMHSSVALMSARSLFVVCPHKIQCNHIKAHHFCSFYKMKATTHISKEGDFTLHQLNTWPWTCSQEVVECLLWPSQLHFLLHTTACVSSPSVRVCQTKRDLRLRVELNILYRLQSRDDCKQVL